MRLSCTVFEILSLIFQKFKRSHDSDHAPFWDSLSSEGWDLLCLTHIPNLKCLRLPATKMATYNVKILVLSHPLGDVGLTHRVHLWLEGKRIVDFLLMIINWFQLAVRRAAPLQYLSLTLTTCQWCRYGKRNINDNTNPQQTQWSTKESKMKQYKIAR